MTKIMTFIAADYARQLRDTQGWGRRHPPPHLLDPVRLPLPSRFALLGR